MRGSLPPPQGHLLYDRPGLLKRLYGGTNVDILLRVVSMSAHLPSIATHGRAADFIIGCLTQLIEYSSHRNVVWAMRTLG